MRDSIHARAQRLRSELDRMTDAIAHITELLRVMRTVYNHSVSSRTRNMGSTLRDARDELVEAMVTTRSELRDVEEIIDAGKAEYFQRDVMSGLSEADMQAIYGAYPGQD